MFRFTIRELVLVTIVVALGVGRAVERQRNRNLDRRVELAENDARQSRVAIKMMYEDLDGIEQALPPHGLTLVWSREMRPTVQELSAGSRPRCDDTASARWS